MRILHLEDSDEDAELVRMSIDARWPDAELHRVSTRDAFKEELKSCRPDLVISDYNLPGFNDLDALQIVREAHPDLPFIFCSGTIGEDRAIDAMRAGATDYVLKERLSRLVPAIERVERERASREAREAAENTVELLVALMDNTTDMVAVCDPEWNCIYLNDAGRKMLGLTRDEPANLKELTPQDVRPYFESKGLPAVERDGHWAGEITLADRAGNRFPASTVVVSHRDRKGTITHFSTITRNVSELHATHRRLLEQTEAITQARDGIVIADADGKITFWNRGAEAILGWTAEETLGGRANRFISPEDPPDRPAGGSNPATRSEQVLHTKDERSVILNLREHTIREGDRPIGILYTFTDLTLQKSLQDQLLRAQRLESLGLLASGISHDLNNILAPILMAAPLLRRQLKDSSGDSLIDMLERSAQRGAELVQQILSFARGVSGEFHLIQLKHVLKEVCSIVERTFPKSIDVVYDFDHELPPVQANPTQMHQFILNLCVNARDAMENGGTLKIRAFSETTRSGSTGEKEVVVEVSDSGTGIPPHVMEKMWEPFFSTKAPGKSTGLGLPTVRGIVQSHGGTIECHSEVGRGTTFRVQLPAVDLATGDDSSRRSDLPRGQDELVLVIDDEQPIANTVSALLRAYGYRTLVAFEATAAIELGAQHADKIKLVLTDYSMPQIDGGALTGVFRKLIPGVRVIISSGHLSPVSFSGRSSPPDKFITKPYSEGALLHIVHEVLRSPPPASKD